MAAEKFSSGKVYYTIGEVSEILKENASLARFWAEKFPQFIKPARNKKGNRLFTAKDVENFKLIHHFVKDLGMTLEGAERRMKENASGEDKRLEVINRLNSIKEKLQAVAMQIAESKSVAEPDDEDIIEAAENEDFPAEEDSKEDSKEDNPDSIIDNIINDK